MHLIQVEAYEYDELDDKAKEKAREWWREGEPSGDWYEFILDDARTCLAFLGFEIKEKDIAFSGFWCQGDGASFVGTWDAEECDTAGLISHAPADGKLHELANRMAILLDVIPADCSDRTARIYRTSHHYAHEFTIDVESGLPDPPESALRDIVRDCCRWIYRRLREEYEDAMSDESVAECIRINEYEFHKDGRRLCI